MVKDVIGKDLVVINEFAPLSIVLDTFSENDALCYPVINANGEFVGIIAFQNIKDTLAKHDLHMLLVAHDLMEPLRDNAQMNDPLQDTLDKMSSMQLDYMPVFAGDDSRQLAGFLDRTRVMHTMTAEILRRSRLSESFT